MIAPPNQHSEIKNQKSKLMGVMRLVARRHRRPGLADEFALRRDRVAEKSLRIDALGRVVRTSVDAARGGKLRTKVAGIRFVGGHFLFLNLHLRGRALCS